MVQLQAINYILKTRDASFFILNNLTEDYFSDFKDEFRFIKQHYNAYGNVPDYETFLNIFEKFNVIEVAENPKYLLDELFKDKQTRHIAECVNKMREPLMRGDVNLATKIYLDGVQELTQSINLESTDIFKDAETRYEAYVDRKEDYKKYYVTTGFPELDEVIGGWDRKEELATIMARPGVGKCHPKGTSIRMADGTTKNVEDIVVGDKVMSEDGPNTVTELHHGFSDGYRIIPRDKSQTFTVTSGHILTLYKANEIWDSSKRMSSTDGTGTLVDMTVEEYLEKSNHYKYRARLYQPTINYNEKALNIPPYILGLWLGDGTGRELTLTTVDSEILTEWNNYAIANGCLVSKRKDGTSYSIIDSEDKRKNSTIRKEFVKYNLFNNKHIPLDYMTSSKEQRLELLAGIIDTDGSLMKPVDRKYQSGYEFSQKSEVLTDQVIDLARGLGFRAVKHIKHNKKYNKDYFRVSICGPLWEIPCRVDRKKCEKRDYDNLHSMRNQKLQQFTVEKVEEPFEYFGFSCDGNNRYILGNGILTHNSWIALRCAVAAAKAGLKVGLYSGEMSENKVGYRIDSLVSGISNYKISKGKEDIWQDYKEYIDKITTGDYLKGTIKVITPASINGPAGVTALRAFIEKENLDMLVIDQHSLLEDDRKGKSPVERAANISRDLKNLQVMKKIPIIAVSQQNRVKAEEGGDIDVANIAQSDRIGQDSTAVIAVEQKDGILTLSLVKSRDSVSGKKLKYAVNFDTGLFEFQPEGDDATGGAHTEDLKNTYVKENEGEEF